MIRFSDLQHTGIRGTPTVTSTTSSSSSGSGGGGGGGGTGFGICGDSVCNDGEKCADNEQTNSNAGSCFKDCGLCPQKIIPEEPEKPIEAITKPEPSTFSERLSNSQVALAGKAYLQNFREVFFDLSWLWVLLVVVILIVGALIEIDYLKKHRKYRKS
ncbi:hypothetical protein J4437_03985 [Candidatus Woesearchaeota archaeon]|nr:hypothetical protein [uncultured archaeon]MBS3123771.1 hypothetical protein [Candidatus Woesearchaeota archaeon]